MASNSSSRPPIPLTAEYIAKQQKAVASLLSPPPWKWPLTHAERIQELAAAKNEPKYARHHDNLDAAIRYHMSFTNQDQLCSTEIVWFQGGKQVGAPYQGGDQRPAWNEGALNHMVNGAGNNSQTAYYALGPAADLIGPISDASYDFHLPTHFHQINIEMTVPVARDGTGERFTSTMGYDTGSNSLSIFQHELFSLFTHTGIQALRWALVEVAGGQHFLPECDVDLRILAENNERVLVDTHTVSATVIMEGSRLSSESLQRHFFVCTHPRTRRVYVAKNKTHLLRSHFMPA